MSFPGGSGGKESACNVGNLGSIYGSGRSPGEGNGKPHWYSCLGNPMDRGAWWATVLGVAKSRTRLSDQHTHFYRCSACGSDGKESPAMQETRVRALGWEDPLEKEMATHSSVLAWEIPWTKKPGGLQSMESQRVRHY